MSVKNPQFGAWIKDDEDTSDIRIGEPVDERAAQALAMVENLRTEAALNLYVDKRKWLHRRITVNSRPTLLPLPLTSVYSRPLTFEEARTLLRSAGIEFRSIDSTYVANFGIIDHDTARTLYPKAQCVVAELPAELVDSYGEVIKIFVNVHLFFIWKKGKGWDLVKAMVEEKF